MKIGLHCTGFKWSNSDDSRLAFVCGTGFVYAWTPQGSAVTDLRTASITTAALKADRIECSAVGQHLMITGKDVGCVCQVK